MFLGFFGAEVLKIESADLEDNRTPEDPNYPELHRTKLSCTIDTRQAEGQVLVKRLATQAHRRGKIFARVSWTVCT